MKCGSTTLTFLHGDHLHSTVLPTRGGAANGQERYYAYGKDRLATATVPTDNRFTGQKEDASGLVYMNARYYDPVTGQFVSPDTLVPDATNLFDYNRYMYVRGNPLKYTDPTGHCIDGISTIFCLMALGALAGGTAGAGWFIVNESHQPDRLDLHLSGTWDNGPVVSFGNDWGDLFVSTGGGALSGGLIASGGTVAVAIGASMAANQTMDHATNSLTGSDFSWQKHAMATATGAAAAVVAPGAGALAKGVPVLAKAPNALKATTEVIASGATQGLINASGDYVLGAANGNAKWDNGTVGWAIVTAGVGQISIAAPNSDAWGAFSTVTSEILSGGARMNVDLISSMYYQPTLTSPIAPFSFSPAP